MNFKPAGITTEGTFTPGLLHAGDHTVRTRGLTVAANQILVRGTLLFMRAAGTEFVAYDGTAAKAGELYAVLTEDVNTTGAARSCTAYISGDFNANSVVVAAGSLNTVRDVLAAQGIYLHTAIAA